MMIEQNTNYAYKLKYMENPTFDKVRDLAIKFMRELPKQLQDELYEALNRGVDILDSEPQMAAYLYAFGPMHQAKLNYAFNYLARFFSQPEINIIDYGCGQALGTMCYADYFRELGYKQQVKTITLIESSELCLKRAALHASKFFPNAKIETIKKSFDELDKDDIYCNEDIPTLHILSNVLDILDFDLEEFAGLIKGQIKGYNQFVCVGPYFNYTNKDKRMERFCSLLNGNEQYNDFFDKYEFDEDKSWTAQIVCFSVIEADRYDLSTNVTKVDLSENVEDEYGVLYSRDGKRLLKCVNLKLEFYRIREGTKTICDSAFSGCESLQETIIPNSITEIGNDAFRYCKSLQQIIIPDSVNVVGDYAFCGCEALRQVDIPNSVAIIGDKAFALCKSLQQIAIPNTVTTIRGDKAFFRCKALQQITLPDTITVIENETFVSCQSLQHIHIPNSVIYIQELAFAGCKSLRQINIPDSVTRIGSQAFTGCKLLQQISIPVSVEYIGAYAFGGCKSLQQIIIPKGSDGKFKKMLDEELWDKLVETSTDSEILSTEANGNGLEETFEDEYGVVYSRDGNRLLKCKNKNIELYNVRQGTRTICDSAFLEIGILKQIVIPDSVTDIEDQAFCGCKSLQKIDIPNSITSIGYNAFGLCESLQYINIPDSVTFLGPATFHKCISLQQVTISNSLARIDYMTFCECNSLQQIVIPNTITIISDWAFSECKSLKQITISDSLSHIGTGAFAKCASLEQFVLPNSIHSIGDSAFEACKNLQQIIIPKESTEKIKEMLDEKLWDRLFEK